VNRRATLLHRVDDRIFPAYRRVGGIGILALGALAVVTLALGTAGYYEDFEARGPAHTPADDVYRALLRPRGEAEPAFAPPRVARFNARASTDLAALEEATGTSRGAPAPGAAASFRSGCGSRAGVVVSGTSATPWIASSRSIRSSSLRRSSWSVWSRTIW
jgi:hypothetical protein